MADTRKDKSVCDLRLIMRARLLCGLYNRRGVHPSWRGFAKAYCLIVFVVSLIFIYFSYHSWDRLECLSWIPGFSLYFLAIFVSLYTEDEYIYDYFSQNKLTDITLDSHTIFNRFQGQINKTHIIVVMLQFVYFGLLASVWAAAGFMFFVLGIQHVIFDLCVAYSGASKLLILGLFNSRLLVLRRRLERYGFRAIGGAPPQPYCEIYDNIWQALDATDSPLKLLTFWEFICSCIRFTGTVAFYLYQAQWENREGVQIIWILFIGAVSFFKRLANSFGHVVLLEEAASHCEAMAIFTATQLIKTPTEQERLRMYALLRALDQRGARYHVLRALPIDAQLMLQVIRFCSAQVIVIINMLKS